MSQRIHCGQSSDCPVSEVARFFPGLPLVWCRHCLWRTSALFVIWLEGIATPLPSVRLLGGSRLASATLKVTLFG